MTLLTTPYAAYRDGLLLRHITVDGRLLSWVWLKEYEPGKDAADLAPHVRSTNWTQGARRR